MNTTELKTAVYRKLAEKFSLNKDEIFLMVDTVIDTMTEGLNTPDEEGESKVVLRNFGTLKVVNRKGRTYSVRGKEVTVGDRKTVVFKPGTGLARSITD